ncbi:hypothetical protein [Streptomyces sp. SAI-041]|uniref:hypothetical protein n=1 Tax=Streptomyces sp. SAI-041 TaxID=2940548 RepID=UPI002476C773|nr:hypothetical protein [Streptomyces sp. SAI-041]MDH6550156.1 hypothetical protein [Streptomyces sp. SAI-041]
MLTAGAAAEGPATLCIAGPGTLGVVGPATLGTGGPDTLGTDQEPERPGTAPPYTRPHHRTTAPPHHGTTAPAPVDRSRWFAAPRSADRRPTPPRATAAG